MVSRENIAFLEKEESGYILGIRLLKAKRVRQEVLSRSGRYREVNDNLRAKEVELGEERYIVCLSPEEAKRDKEKREQLVAYLKEKLKKSPLTIITKRGYKKYLKIKKNTLKLNLSKIKEEARFDGKFVLTTNTELAAEEVAVTYKNLLQVECAFRHLKDILETRPVYNQTAENTKGHVFCSYLALLSVIVLRRRLNRKGDFPSWHEIIRDLCAFQAVKIQIGGKEFLIRSDF